MALRPLPANCKGAMRRLLALTLGLSLTVAGVMAPLPGLSILPVEAAGAYQLASYKDRLFAYPGILKKRYGGDFLTVDYREARDIDKRDALPQQKVKGYYVSLRANKSGETGSWSFGGKRYQYEAVGRAGGGAKAITLYIHGRGGNRGQGVNDWSFGGNFNRIKNLMARNDGLYVSPDVPDFTAKGAQAIAALIGQLRETSPEAAVFLACGSMGGEVCWHSLENAKAASQLDGVLFLGTVQKKSFFSTPTFKGRTKAIPLYFGHGTRDHVFPFEDQVTFFETVKTRRADYPIRLVLFESGTHGTPIRMTDWRKTLNWMLAQRR